MTDKEINEITLALGELRGEVKSQHDTTRSQNAKLFDKVNENGARITALEVGGCDKAVSHEADIDDLRKSHIKMTIIAVLCVGLLAGASGYAPEVIQLIAKLLEG